jgi:hypothetical protein
MPASKSAQKESALVALLAGCTVEEAAAKAKVSRRTISTWKADPDFRSQLHERRAEMVEAGVDILRDGLTRAARCLVDKLDSGNDQVAVSAARSLLEYGFKGLEALDHAQRLERLEKALESEEEPTHAGNGQEHAAAVGANGEAPPTAPSPGPGPDGGGPGQGALPGGLPAGPVAGELSAGCSLTSPPPLFPPGG